jgi:hypothetical protein
MIVMPANSSGWFWHSLARETGRLGHLYSVRRDGGISAAGPWPWFPYALDNGAYTCWDRDTNTFDDDQWDEVSRGLEMLHRWAHWCGTPPLWTVIPDVPGDAARTIERWTLNAAMYAEWPRALAVQDGMTAADVKRLDPLPARVLLEPAWSSASGRARTGSHHRSERSVAMKRRDWVFLAALLAWSGLAIWRVWSAERFRDEWRALAVDATAQVKRLRADREEQIAFCTEALNERSKTSWELAQAFCRERVHGCTTLVSLMKRGDGVYECMCR